MKRRVWLLLLIPLLAACAGSKNPITAPHPGTTDVFANSTYDLIVSAKGYLDSEKSQHPECSTTSSDVCGRISQAVGAKDVIIDALSSYCAGPVFDATGGQGACNPPAAGTPALTQAKAKVQSAINGYNQIAADLKKATGGD